MKKTVLGMGLAALLVSVLPAQDANTTRQRVNVPFSDPGAPRKLVVDGLVGAITVRGYEGKDAVVEYNARVAGPRANANTPPPPGMHRIGGARDLEVTEDHNVIHVNHGSFMFATDLVIQVPVDTSVTVSSLAGGAGGITVENISGEIEASNMAGPVTITNASGSVVAHSMAGKITVALNKVMPDKSMSFSTMNGDIDVTLPSDTKARLKMKTDNGDIFTDFDVTLDPQRTAAPVVEPKPKETKNGKEPRAPRVRVRVDSTTYGTINGGGPEMQFTTFNGRILIHKK